MQETFFAYYGHYPLTWDDRKVRYYLAKILTNKCRDYYRSRNRRPVEYMDPTELRNISFGNKVGQDPLSIVMELQACKATAAGLKTMKKEWSSIAGNKYTGNQRDDEYFRGCMQNEIDARARASVSDG